MRSFISILSFLLILGTNGSGNVDSLLNLAGSMPKDTSKLPVLKQLVRNYVFTRPDSALPFAREFTSIAISTQDPELIGQGFNFQGLAHQVKNDYDSAMIAYVISLEYFEKGNDPWFTAMLYNNIGGIHQTQERLELANDYYTKAYKGFTEIGDTVWIANVSNNIANILYASEDWDSAGFYYNRSVEVLEEFGAREFAAAAKLNRANCLMRAGDLKSAARDYNSVLEALPKGSDDQTRAMALVNRGECYRLAGDLDSSVVSLREAIALADGMGIKDQLLYGHDQLAQTFEKMGLLDSALANHKLAAAWKDSIFNEEKSAQIAELQERYDSQKKDLEIEKNQAALERSDLQNKALAGGAFLLLLAGVFAFRAYQTKKKSSERLAQQNSIIERALSEKELLLREIHHRVKNNLQVISSLLSLQSRKINDEKALEAVTASRNRVKSMALIHQNLYKEDDLTGIDIADYVSKLVNSLIGSYKINEDQITVATDIQSMSLDVDTTIPLGLILNELITNALKYAFPEGESGTICVRLAEAHGSLELEVRDNGVGYHPNAEKEKESSSFGFNMIDAFCKKLKAEWEVMNDNGTVVKMKIQKYKLSS